MSSIRTLSKLPSGFEDENARYPLVPLAILRRLRWNSDSVGVALNCSDIWDEQFFFLSFFGLLSYVTYIHTYIHTYMHNIYFNSNFSAATLYS